MIGKTNCKAAQEQPCEKVNVNIRSDSDSFPGTTFTISYGSYSKTYTWTGSVMTIDIPAYVEYTISFSDVNKFTTPASVTNMAQAGNSRTVDVVYMLAVEKLTVKVSGITSGYTITVVNATTGATIGTQTTASQVYSIPDGTKYYVKASAYSGYNTPANSSTYTAVGNGTRTVTMTYTLQHTGTINPTNGVYIQDTDGYLHTEAEWDGTYTPNGIAVITSNCRFVIALEDEQDITYEWGGYGTTVSGITTTTDKNTAKTDYDGEAQTTTIINALKGTNDGYVDGAPAVEYCRAYTFPDGSIGYMGAAGEWQAVLDNEDAIRSALTKCSGIAIHNYYWTSTQYSSDQSWYTDFINNGLGKMDKTSDLWARAFAVI